MQISDNVMDNIEIEVVSEEELKDLMIDFSWCIGVIACGSKTVTD